jgi:predicted transcriptional regulator
MENKITRAEFESAMQIIVRYKNQLSDEINEINLRIANEKVEDEKIDLNINTLVIDLQRKGLGTRTLNILHSHAATSDDFRKMRLVDLSKVSLTELKKVRSYNKTTASDIIETLNKVGLPYTI